MNLIEKLKDNEAHRIFADMTPEEQECLRTEAKKGNVQCLECTMKWANRAASTGALVTTSIYRIAPSYQPEPEYMDYTIIEKIYDKWLVDTFVLSNLIQIQRPLLGIEISDEFVPLFCLPSLPDFFCFWQEENNEGYKDTEHISFEVVATAINGGMKVYARFRKAL